MGVVYMAEQTTPVERRVALKIVKPGMDSRQIIARFEAERQALAMMDHPNIAKVLDAGTVGGRDEGGRMKDEEAESSFILHPSSFHASGRPYFVMELVKGVPITRYCDEKQLGIKARLELMIPVCQAIQHAHQKGVIHRDIKPSNVLVTQYDGKPVPKVIDFGVAKAIGQKLTERTMFTALGQIVGTLEYMSPEQAELNQLDIDTRSDIYSLGVLLYELLTGTTPFDKQKLKSAALDEILRIIREDEPPKPSTRLSTIDTLPSVAANRGIEAARLRKFLRGELDWIVMKALDKDRGRRYETANALALDLERFLSEEPVQACPPSAVYRLQKFARRNKGAVLAGTLVLGALVVGLLRTTWQAIRATLAERRALDSAASEHFAKEAEKGERKKADAARELAVQQAAIANAVSDFLQNDLLGQANLFNQPGEAAGEAPRDPDVPVRELLDRASKSLESKFADQPLTEAAIRLTIGSTYVALGQYPEAERHLERSLALRQAKLGPTHADTLVTKQSLANLSIFQANYERAETLCREAIAGWQALGRADHQDLLAAQHTLATAQMRQGKSEDAERLLVELVQTSNDRLGPGHLNTIHTQIALAELHKFSRAFDQAEQLLRACESFNFSPTNGSRTAIAGLLGPIISH